MIFSTAGLSENLISPFAGNSPSSWRRFSQRGLVFPSSQAFCKVFADHLSELTGRLDQLETILADAGFAAGPNFTFADCALAPTIFIANNTLQFLGAKPAIEDRPKVFRWWSAVQTRPSVKKALTEMAEALALQMQRG